MGKFKTVSLYLLKHEDYRPISILPALSKALEMLMRDQMVEFLDSNNALDALQSGFRTGHSTTTALLCITDDIYKYLDGGMFVILVLLDFLRPSIQLTMNYFAIN
jgi:Reverse transcriptase (RNA-dependent DNA polymerase)